MNEAFGNYIKTANLVPKTKPVQVNVEWDLHRQHAVIQHEEYWLHRQERLEGLEREIFDMIVCHDTCIVASQACFDVIAQMLKGLWTRNTCQDHD